MKKKNLVSIITPCFNGEKFVHRLLDSVLEQTYPSIEHIFIDDGSTDKTAEIIKTYILKYKARGIKLIYVYQENARAAAALNRGLKLFTGDYLTWPDSDDYYRSNDAIATMVAAFENLSNEYGMVRCDAMLTEENTQEALSKFSNNNPNVRKESLFEDCLLEINFWFTPGCYLTSAAVLDDVIGEREIFVNMDAQNFQMFLPIFYKYKCFYIDKPLFNYLVRSNSYCNQPIPFDLAIKRSLIHNEIIEQTLKRMNLDQNELDKYLMQIKRKYLNRRVGISYSYMKKEEFDLSFFKLKTDFPQDISLKLRIKKEIVNWPIIYRVIKRMK
jgi:glycosyltransferase involved in cell wall biosynthesis